MQKLLKAAPICPIILLLLLTCGCNDISVDDMSQVPSNTSKKSGYLVLYRPQETVGDRGKLTKWLDNLELRGYKLVTFNNNNGNYIFHKD